MSEIFALFAGLIEDRARETKGTIARRMVLGLIIGVFLTAALALGLAAAAVALAAQIGWLAACLWLAGGSLAVALIAALLMRGERARHAAALAEARRNRRAVAATVSALASLALREGGARKVLIAGLALAAASGLGAAMARGKGGAEDDPGDPGGDQDISPET